ncbi:hypothetical protein [Longimicrobium sp.]|uniref:hypothetical protein n=1 Tax=Longimicrobium sp. TaxID=2029185 RepID=UPI002CBE74C3|nr:hypothetical protein [Longimicrobium sp.]HSU16369.1 hypothetical protein [Longimicrobium sp.]
MNRKLTLNVDALSVTSFGTGGAVEARGTVQAHDKIPCPSAGYPQSCYTIHTCASFDISCRADA